MSGMSRTLALTLTIAIPLTVLAAVLYTLRPSPVAEAPAIRARTPEPAGPPAGPPAPPGLRRRPAPHRAPRRAMPGSVGALVPFGAGLFSFLSPCVRPLFPSYVSFTRGMRVSDLPADLTGPARRRVMLHALAFVLGFSLVFV